MRPIRERVSQPQQWPGPAPPHAGSNANIPLRNTIDPFSCDETVAEEDSYAIRPAPTRVIRHGRSQPSPGHVLAGRPRSPSRSRASGAGPASSGGSPARSARYGETLNDREIQWDLQCRVPVVRPRQRRCPRLAEDVPHGHPGPGCRAPGPDCARSIISRGEAEIVRFRRGIRFGDSIGANTGISGNGLCHLCQMCRPDPETFSIVLIFHGDLPPEVAHLAQTGTGEVVGMLDERKVFDPFVVPSVGPSASPASSRRIHEATRTTSLLSSSPALAPSQGDNAAYRLSASSPASIAVASRERALER